MDGPGGAATAEPPVQVDLGSDLTAVRRARAVLRCWCEHLRLSPETSDVVLLLGSELATNAVLHGGGPVELSVRLRGSRLWLGFSDTSPEHPRARSAGPEDLGGRGVHLLTALACEWGVVPAPPGKTVWCSIATSS